MPGILPRLLRALTVTTVVLGLSATAHTRAGAHLPGPVVMAALAAVVLLLVLPLTRRTLRPVPLLALLGAGQLALHHVLVLLTATARCAPVAVHEHHTVLVCDGMVEQAAAHGATTTSMVLAHVLATLASAAAISHGEAVLRALLAPVRSLLDLPQPVVLPGVPRQRVAGLSFVPCGGALVLPPPTRGPPPVSC